MYYNVCQWTEILHEKRRHSQNEEINKSILYSAEKTIDLQN